MSAPIHPDPATDAPLSPSGDASAADGELTPLLLAGLRKTLHWEDADRARQNAIAHNDIDELALNHAALAGRDTHFSHQVRTKGVTHQKKSGRCWMFAALNTLRPHVIREHEMEGFEFSVSYLQFWDKLERANLYFEEVIEMRDTDFLDREWENLNQWALHDGGWWNYLIALVRKYGVVPDSAMPETHSSTHTEALNRVLHRFVRSRAAAMLKRHADGASVDELRSLKEEALAGVYRLLAISLGEPPSSFRWRFRQQSQRPDDPEALAAAEDKNLSAEQRFTPQEFQQRFVGDALDELVCLYHDPKVETGRHYVFERAKNIVGSHCMNFVNVGMHELKQAAIRSILANEAMWFAVNMSIDQSRKRGVMLDGLFDYESLFGTDLELDKADRARFREGASNHAMALVGVDLDAEERPRKWLAENSWGKDDVESGRWIMDDAWFDEHTYTILVHRRHVPEEILAAFDEEPTTLPSWYPGASGVA